jgi:phosphate uptake regulator
MKPSFWKTLLASESLIEDAKADSLRMLDAGQEMFNVVLHVMKERREKGVRQQVARMDKSLNNLQREVRKKVYEHLVISRARDLATGLQLTSIVIDLERIGDYTKNMAELLDLFPDEMNWEPYQDQFEQVRAATLELFELTRRALADDDEEAARKMIKKYDRISKICDGTLEDVMEAQMDSPTVEKRFLSLVLIMRYLKRVNAHLKNIATSVVNPFHEIGFRPGAV